MKWLWFGIGLAAGALVVIPLAALAARHQTRRVRRLERHARATERLAELGTLTGGLAHEIKNPLSTVGLNIQLLQEDLQALSIQAAGDGPLQEKIGRIQRRFESLTGETRRLRDILEDFLRYAGRVKLHRVQSNVNAMIDELVDFFAPQAQADSIHIRSQLTAHPGTLWIDTNLLKQAVLNIVINATQAMVQARDDQEPSGGSDELIIRTLRGRSHGQDEIRIHVTDTGPGIQPDRLRKIFHPYFSSKKTGTGLGLPTARRIVEEHGGHITVHSEPGRGTDFVITLPVNPPADTADDAGRDDRGA